MQLSQHNASKIVLFIFFLVYIHQFQTIPAEAKPISWLIGLSSTQGGGGFGQDGYTVNTTSIDYINLKTGDRQQIVSFPATSFSATAYAVDYFRHIAYFQKKQNGKYIITAVDLNTDIVSDLGEIAFPFTNFGIDLKTGFLVGLVFTMPPLTPFIDPSKGGLITGSNSIQIYDPSNNKLISTKMLDKISTFNPAILRSSIEKPEIYIQGHDSNSGPVYKIATNAYDTEGQITYNIDISQISKTPTYPLSAISSYDPKSQRLVGLRAGGCGMGDPMGHFITEPDIYALTINTFNPTITNIAFGETNTFAKGEDIDNNTMYIQYHGNDSVHIAATNTATSETEDTLITTDKPLHAAVFDTPTLEYVALGDSYSAGTGADTYYLSGKFDNDQTFCHRSPNAYSMQLNIDDIFPNKKIRKWFYACHGAELINIFNQSWDGLSSTSSVAEPPQGTRIPTKFADIISLTLSGNDMQFGKIMSLLASGTSPDTPIISEEIFQKLPLSSVYSETQRQSFTLRSAIHESTPLLKDRIEQMIITLKQQSKPGARIFYLGYPPLFPETKTPLSEQTVRKCFYNLFSKEQMDFANEETNNLNNTIKSACEQTNITFVNVTDYFKGHEACSSALGSEPYLTDIDGFDTSQPMLISIFSESFHPNKAGHLQYSNALKSEILATADTQSTKYDTQKQVTQGYTKTDTTQIAKVGELNVSNYQDKNTDTRKIILRGSGFLHNSQVYIAYKTARDGKYIDILTDNSDDFGNLSSTISIPTGTLSNPIHIIAAGMHSESQANLLFASVASTTQTYPVPPMFLLLN